MSIAIDNAALEHIVDDELEDVLQIMINSLCIGISINLNSAACNRLSAACSQPWQKLLTQL